MYAELLEGAYDLHVHTGPDVNERKLDDLEMAERIFRIGMKGFGIKSHYFCTAERARLVKKLYPGVQPADRCDCPELPGRRDQSAGGRNGGAGWGQDCVDAYF